MAESHPWLLPLCLGLFGLSIGSYLNVVIYRLPRGMSTNEPNRSFCTSCRAPIAWYHNLPVLSWLWLRGKSACCGQKISARYILVELLTAALFVAMGYEFRYETFLTQASFCVWAACALAIFFIDWEQMVVLPSLTLIAAGAGLLAALVSPWVISLGLASEPIEGLFWCLGGGAFGFVLFKAVALLGRGLFGRKRAQFAQPTAWSMAESADKNDIILRVGETEYLWSELFMEASDRLTLSACVLELTPPNGQTQKVQNEPASLIFSPEHVQLADGRSLPLADYKCASGTCSAWQMSRAAMGSGDAWIALAIGAACGWQGVLFALVAGSLIGISWALLARIGRGQPMPFGPCLILATFLWIFWASSLDFSSYCLTF